MPRLPFLSAPTFQASGLVLVLVLALLPAAAAQTSSSPPPPAAAAPAAAAEPPSTVAAPAGGPATGAPAGTAGRAAGAEPAAQAPAAPQAAAPAPAAAAPPSAESAQRLPRAPVNLDFEQGEVGEMPAGWQMTSASERAGFGAEVSDLQPYEGQRCALVHSVAFHQGSLGTATGTLVQRFSAADYRGRRVRFRAAVRTSGDGTRARLWLAVERPGNLPGFLDNMADRPIVALPWQVYEITGEVAPDATRIGIGMTVTGDGKAWIDDAAFEVLGPAGAGDAPPRPLMEPALTDLVALARLVGYVRYFHPSDQAAAADWGAFAAAAVARLDPGGAGRREGTSRRRAELAAALQALFAPLAPTLRVFPSAGPRPALDLGLPPGSEPAALRTVAWSHIGLGASGRPSPFSSVRVFGEPGQAAAGDLDPHTPFTADLGGGVSCMMPLVLYADRAGTLPRAAAALDRMGTVAMQAVGGQAAADGEAKRSTAGDSPGGAAPATVLSADDRNARLAIVMLAWNVIEHFQPRLAPGDPRWPKALRQALQEAAAGSGYESLVATLRRMVAVTADGQATMVGPGDAGRYMLPLRWDWIEDQLVITEAGAAAAGVHVGDAVERLGSRDARAVVAAAETELPAATAGWRRWRALNQLAAGNPGSTMSLTVRGLAAPAAAASAAPPRAAGAALPQANGAAPPQAAGASSLAAAREVEVPYTLPPGRLEIATPPGEAVREASPGILVVDLGRLSDSDLMTALPRLAQAQGIVFDLRGAVRATDRLLGHLITEPVETRREMVPHWSRPDRQAPLYTPLQAALTPQAPHIGARLAFVAAARDVGVAESFLATVAAYHLGAIVGSASGGATGSVDSAPLAGGFTLVWTATLPAPGSPPAGTPVEPTVPAAATRQGLAAGRDEVLEKALALVSPDAAPPAGAATP
jgi:hypothetical protein